MSYLVIGTATKAYEMGNEDRKPGDTWEVMRDNQEGTLIPTLKEAQELAEYMNKIWGHSASYAVAEVQTKFIP